MGIYEGHQTPFYIINKTVFNKNIDEIEQPFFEAWGRDNVIFTYSVKTNNNRILISEAVKRGWGAEVVSYDEYKYIKETIDSFSDCLVICNGPVKGNMLSLAARRGDVINLDNLDEVDELIKIVQNNNIDKTKLKIGIRINCNLEKHCPGQTTAGIIGSRFGIDYESDDLFEAIKMLREADISINGIHMHTSTDSRSLEVFRWLAEIACEVADKHCLDLDYIDIGGGFFGGRKLEGKPTMCEYADVITSVLKKWFSPNITKLILEPGASIISTAVDYVCGVANVRTIKGRRIVTLDGTALHINPFLVNRRPVYEVIGCGNEFIKEQMICGCTCLEKDRFDVIKNGKALDRNSTIIFHNAGGYTMSFNSRFIIEPPKVYVEE